MTSRREEAAALVRDSLVWDNVWPLEPDVGNDLGRLPEFRAAGFDVISLTIAGDNHSSGEAFARVAAARRRIEEAPGARLVESIAGIKRARGEGELAVLLHFEGTRCFERNLDLVDAFYGLGVRHTLLAFNQSNSVGGGCAEAGDGGLTRFGRLLVMELERTGMLIDLSHTGRRTSLDALEQASKPAVFSHSNADAVWPHFRNVTDDQIRACAATGGLIGLSGSSIYLGDAEVRSETMFRHLDHVVQLVGPEHACLGLDIVFDTEPLNRFMRARPEEWPDAARPDWPGAHYARPAQIVELADLMLGAGYGEPAVGGILGENLVRVCGSVWR
ncbi:MAG: rane dipeptidase [Rhodospirillales bacterium]|nr:rane dipeptidase [Rhodospirillales bacterium]